MLEGQRDEAAEEEPGRDRAEGQGQDGAERQRPDEPGLHQALPRPVVELASEAGQADPLEEDEADGDEQRPEDPVHVRLEEERHLRDRQQASHQDRGERRVREGPAQGVEKPPDERAPAAADLPADVGHGRDVRRERAGADRGQQPQPESAGGGRERRVHHDRGKARISCSTYFWKAALSPHELPHPVEHLEALRVLRVHDDHRSRVELEVAHEVLVRRLVDVDRPATRGCAPRGPAAKAARDGLVGVGLDGRHVAHRVVPWK